MRGGVATYAQAGQNYGTRLLWVLALLIPVLIVNQEMVVRMRIGPDGLLERVHGTARGGVPTQPPTGRQRSDQAVHRPLFRPGGSEKQRGRW